MRRPALHEAGRAGHVHVSARNCLHALIIPNSFGMQQWVVCTTCADTKFFKLPCRLEAVKFETQCDCLARNMECGPECGCTDGGACLNRAVTERRTLQLGADVHEIDSWGFDCYTRRNIHDGAAILPGILAETSCCCDNITIISISMLVQSAMICPHMLQSCALLQPCWSRRRLGPTSRRSTRMRCSRWITPTHWLRGKFCTTSARRCQVRGRAPV